MADTLFPAGAQLLDSAAQTSNATQQQQQAKTDTTVKSGDAASANLTGEREQMSADQAKMALEAMNEKFNTVEITPQLAMGLVRNTGDKEWMKAIGQKMRADMYTAIYTHGINNKIFGKEYKFKDGDQEKAGTFELDPETNEPSFKLLGSSTMGQDTEKAKKDRESREKLAKAKEAAAKSKSEKTSEDPKDREFEKTYRQNQKDTEGMNYILLDQMAKKDPKQAGDLRSKLDFVQKNQDRFNSLQGIKPDVSHGTNQPQKFNSADDVRAAYKAGKMSREDAKKILADQFGMK